MKQPRIIGITGNIGAGKSTVADFFSAAGWPVFNADQSGKIILTKSLAIVKKITSVFGEEVLGENGFPDRAKLASTVFNNEEKLEKLNAIIHPEVKKMFENWIAAQHTSIVFRESALLFEIGIDKESWKNIVVTCPLEERIKRVVARGGINDKEARLRESKQLREEEKASKADFIVDNFEKPILPQLVEIEKQLKVLLN